MSLVANFERFQAAKSQADASTALWTRLRQEAEEAFSRECALSPLFINSILNRSPFEDAVIHRISARLGNEIVPAYLIADVFAQAVALATKE
jgi:serine O-acetyltransferase